jgi:hypothetical protein
MGGKVIKYTFITIGVYLGVAYATGGGKLIKAGSAGGVGLIKALQGRG